MHTLPRSRKLLLLVGAIVAFAAVAMAPQRAQAAGCDRVAAWWGSDSAAGTLDQPFESVQQLANSLGAGETGCVRAGNYHGNVAITSGGTRGAPLTITSYPGEWATVIGKLWLPEGADFVTISSLDLDGRNPEGLPSPAISADNVTFTDNDVTNNHLSSCFNLGPTTNGRAVDTVITRNRIHNCGDLPATGFEHGIYVEHAYGTEITENLIYDNADRGVQLYPDAQDTYVARNVIDGNGAGVLVAGGSEEYGPQASSGNVIERNMITNSNQRENIGAHWGGGLVGAGNVVRANCVFGGVSAARNQGLFRGRGLTAHDNVLADPHYVDRPGKNFRLAPGSPCVNLSVPPAQTRAAARPRLSLTVTPRSLRAGSLRITGRLENAGPRRRVEILVRVRTGWRRLLRLRPAGDGAFAARVRLKRRSARGGLRLSSLTGVRLPAGARVLKLRAAAGDIGRSRVVTVRLRRR